MGLLSCTTCKFQHFKELFGKIRNNYLFILFIYQFRFAIRAGSPKQREPITVGPYHLTPPINFPHGWKPEKLSPAMTDIINILLYP